MTLPRLPHWTMESTVATRRPLTSPSIPIVEVPLQSVLAEQVSSDGQISEILALRYAWMRIPVVATRACG